MKECKRCKANKEASLFPKNKAMKDGLHYYCKECTRSASLKQYHAGRAMLSEDSDFAERETLCQSCNILKKNKHFGVNNRAMTECTSCQNFRRRASRYSLTKEKLAQMLEGGCNSCGSFEKLCVDHDHSCCSGNKSCGNCVRGILCKDCNTLEGLLLSNKNRLPLLQNYLSKWYR